MCDVYCCVYGIEYVARVLLCVLLCRMSRVRRWWWCVFVGVVLWLLLLLRLLLLALCVERLFLCVW